MKDRRAIYEANKAFGQHETNELSNLIFTVILVILTVVLLMN